MTRLRGLSLWVCVGTLGLAGCAGPGSDPTDVMFEPDRIIEVDIQLPTASWDALRMQDRGDFYDVFAGPNCLSQPFASPYNYFNATVTVDGQTVDNVGVRKKGFFGSQSVDKPSLKIKFSHNDPGLRVNGMRRMTLNNGRQDASLIKQCIGYDVLAQAGLAAARCSFAHVTVNGADLGIYVHVDSIKKPFIGRHFSDDSGNLYEGTISDFRPEWRGTFEKKTNTMDPSQPDIDAMVTAMMSDDTQLVAALEPLIDIDQFINFWVMEVIIGHWDGYAGNNNNYYLYNDPTSNRLHFIPWGIDGILQGRGDAPNSVLGAGELARRLYNIPVMQARYVQHMRDMLNQVWDETVILAEVERMRALIAPIADTTPAFSATIDAVRLFVSGRRLEILSELEAGPPTLDNGPRPPFCVVDIGTVDATFSTTWGTIGDDVFTAGTSVINGSINGTPIASLQSGSKAGWNPERPPGTQGQLQLVTQTSATEFLVVFFNIDPRIIVPGVLGLNFGETIGIVANFDSTAQTFTLVGYVVKGAMTFTVGGTNNGDALTGTLFGTVIEPF